MPLATLKPSGSTVVAQELTPESFARFGGVISAPHQLKTAKQSSANYGTAVKMNRVTPIENEYSKAPSGTPATANFNVFVSYPPAHKFVHKDGRKVLYPATVLERHPYTTQTFLPMGKSPSENAFLVIVAESDPATTLPNPATVASFVAKGNQAVTYGVGTWHSPMIALADAVEFAVHVHENGVPDEDTQEVYFEPAIEVVFDSDREYSKL